jgi:hypothetical protein
LNAIALWVRKDAGTTRLGRGALVVSPGSESEEISTKKEPN